jgi:hypothetical protein
MNSFFTWNVFLEVGEAQDLPSKIWQTLGCNMFVISHILPITKATLVRYSSSLARNNGDAGSLVLVSCPLLN